MASETKTLTLLTCDLCGFKKDPEKPDAGWGKLRGQTSGGAPLVANYEADVCPTCARLYKGWEQSRRPLPFAATTPPGKET